MNTPPADATAARVLIADDEEIILMSTADLLRRHGFVCVTAPDGPTALGLLAEQDFDLLIADIMMPGNPGLELVRGLPERAQGMPVILMTGHPSMQSAIDSIQLPVLAYLVKPVDFELLLGHVRRGVALSQTQRTIRGTRAQLARWSDELARLEAQIDPSGRQTRGDTMNEYVTLVFGNIMQLLLGLKNALDGVEGEAAGLPGLELTTPRLEAHRTVIRDTIETLERTKRAFKSKELGELRQRLEQFIHLGN